MSRLVMTVDQARELAKVLKGHEGGSTVTLAEAGSSGTIAWEWEGEGANQFNYTARVN